MSDSRDYVNEKLPLKQLIPLGLQHVLSMYAGALVVPIVLAAALGLNAQQTAYLIAADLFTCGIATLIQAYGIGNYAGIKLPTILGCSFVAVGPMIAIGTSVGGGTVGLTVIYGATIVSGLLLWATSGLFGKLTRFFPPVVTGTVITVVGLTLIPMALNNAAGGLNNPDFADPKNLGLALFVLIVVIIMNRFFTGFMQSISVLAGLLAGTIVAYFMGMVDFTEVSHAGWFEIITPFHFGLPKFELTSIISLTLVAIVTSVEAIGVFLGLGQICEKEVTQKDIIKGLRAEGIAKTMGGIFNSFPYATFSQNVGLVTLSGVKSRFVCVAAGIILIILGVLPKFAALGTAIPMSVLGGATLAMFGMVAVSGLRILSGVDFKKQGNLLIIAISIAVGLGCKVSQDALVNLPETFKTIFQDGIILACGFAIILNILFNYDEIKEKAAQESLSDH